ncbi:MAG: hypothetical protein QXL17_04305 [Candidatus Thermoplasmatota archaeon]
MSKISENDQNQEERITSVKSHEDILKLFKEIEEIETRMKTPLVIEDIEEAQPDVTISPNLELIEIQPEETEPNTQQIPVGSKISKRKSVPKFFFKKKKQPEDTEDIKKTKFLKFWKKDTEKELHPTFTLKIDSEGNLIGLNIKKPKPPREKKQRFRFLHRKHEKPDTQTPSTETEKPSSEHGLKGKMKRIIQRVIPKRKTKKEGTSKLAVFGKVKKIIKRK